MTDRSAFAAVFCIGQGGNGCCRSTTPLFGFGHPGPGAADECRLGAAGGVRTRTAPFGTLDLESPASTSRRANYKEANSTPAGPRMSRVAKQSAERLLGDDGQNLDGGWTARNVIDCFDFPRIGAWSGHRCVHHGHPQCLLSRSASELPVGAPPRLPPGPSGATDGGSAPDCVAHGAVVPLRIAAATARTTSSIEKGLERNSPLTSLKKRCVESPAGCPEMKITRRASRGFFSTTARYTSRPLP